MDIIQDIRAGKISPVYLLHGEEIYYVQKILYFFENQLLTPEQASFNLNIFYGKDTDVMQLLDTARQYPLMSQIQLIIVKEAQDLRRIEDLQAY
ncbi:MAG: DNA polymerase III subunit delta, partial [Saprospiraceae bacterium]